MAYNIGIQLQGIGTFDVNRVGNVQGDELIAWGWKKYLERDERVAGVTLFDVQQRPGHKLDVVIHFHPDMQPIEGVRNLLYLQNAFPKNDYPGGTVGVFNRAKDKFDGYLFTSEALMKACADGAVVPFATDPERFRPMPDSAYRHPVCFVGNDFRGPVVNRKYITPALAFGLVIYGNRTWQAPLDRVCQGKLPMEDLPKLYSSSEVCLNAHIPEHIEWSTHNSRIYDVLACGGFVLSDYVDGLDEAFDGAVVTTSGDEDCWAKLAHYLNDADARVEKARRGHVVVTTRHGFANRTQAVLKYIDQVI